MISPARWSASPTARPRRRRSRRSASARICTVGAVCSAGSLRPARSSRLEGTQASRRSLNRAVSPAKKTELHIGTSGWTYDGWRGSFYPKDIPKRCWLEHYASVFNSTEINGSFYRTPSLEAVHAWRDTTPKDFSYAWKASKFITHWKRLTEKCENSIELMETRLKALGSKAAGVLFHHRRISARTSRGYAHSSRCCRSVTATHSNSAIRP